MKPKVVIVIGFIIAVGVILYAATRKGTGSTGTGSTSGPTLRAADPDPGGPGVEISFEYSTEKKDWLGGGVRGFPGHQPGHRGQADRQGLARVGRRDPRRRRQAGAVEPGRFAGGQPARGRL